LNKISINKKMKNFLPKGFILSSARIDVWEINLQKHDDSVELLKQVLSPDEVKRAERFKIKSKQNEFVLTRGCLRIILSTALGIDAKQLEFAATEQGKPYLKAPCPVDQRICFNVSHSHGFALIAVSLDRDLGVDIERIQNRIDYASLAERFFNPDETKAIMAFPEDKRLEAFYVCWARKEALLKAIGNGISMGLGKFQVSVDPAKPASLVAALWDDFDKDKWWISDLEIHPEYAAAVAARGDRVEVQLRDLFSADPST